MEAAHQQALADVARLKKRNRVLRRAQRAKTTSPRTTRARRLARKVRARLTRR